MIKVAGSLSLSLSRSRLILSFTRLDLPYPITIFIACVWSLIACDLCIHTHWAAAHVSAMNKLITVIYGHYDCFLRIHACTALQARRDISSKSQTLPPLCIHNQLQKDNHCRVHLHNDTYRHLGHT